MASIKTASLYCLLLLSPAVIAEQTTIDSDAVQTIEKKWMLDSTIIFPNKRLAIINGVQLTIGDEIDGAIIIDVTHEHATLLYQDKNIELNLNETYIDYIVKPIKD